MSAVELPPEAADELGPDFTDLPDAVRTRLVSVVAAALPEVAVLPPALRRIRDFAPARRARAGASAIGAALGEEEFRARVALVASHDGSDGSDGADGSDADLDSAGVAARAWLARDDGWLERLAEALADLAERGRTSGRDVASVARLVDRLDAAERSLKDARVRHRAELDDLKTENARLRRTLGEERRARKEERTAAQTGLAEADAARASAEALAATRDREARQLTARVARLDAEAGADRRTAKADRDEATVRARLLLDTVLDAASGLRRELGLPPATTTPAERVERGLTSDGAGDVSSTGRLGPDSAALLDNYLAMPRTRLIVDGYNVTKAAWPSLPLESQRIRLVNALAPLVARTGAETTVVFDAYAVGSRPVVPAPRGVRVVFSPEGVIADDVIRELVSVEPTGRVVVVVTADAELASDVRRDGARICAPPSLVSLL